MKYITPDWPAPTNVKACTTVRESWGKSYPENTEDRQKLRSLLQLPADPIWMNQTHSTLVLEATPENQNQTADAAFTNQTNRVCVTLTADCLPIFICNRLGTHVAAIHAGWRGLARGIVENTLDALAQPTSDLMAWLGPAIGPHKFEVGVDVYDAFTLSHPESKIAFTSSLPGKWLADLYTLAKIRLASRGLSKIYGGNFCTYTQADLFFSYRRDKGKTGRMASVIWMEGEER